MVFKDNTYTPAERLRDLLSQLTLEEKLYMLSTHHRAVPRLGICEWYIGCEVARGFVSKNPEEISTVFPQPIGLASTFDPELMYALGDIAGNEARFYYQKDTKGRLMLWGPTVDPERDPRWGRTEEGYGEDPYLIGEMTKAYTLGMAGMTDGTEFYMKTVPTLKHFCANNNENQRVNCSADVNMRTLHEYYYEAFRVPVKEGGARSLMCAYNELAGVPACMNPHIEPVVKADWGLDFVVTDGADFSQNVLAHGSHSTHSEALAACIKAGTDVMTDNEEMVAEAARNALRKGLLTEADIDKAIGKSLFGRMRLGHFDEDHPYKNMDVTVDSEESRTVNRRAAMEQVCLLKNDGVLPLSKGKKIAVIGPIADENYRDWYTGVASYSVSIKEGIERAFGSENVTFDHGYDIVRVKSRLTGKYLGIDNEGVIKAQFDAEDDSTAFQYHNWGMGSCWSVSVNLKSCANGKYVIEDGTYKATSKTPYEWFIKEWLKPSWLPDGSVTFRSWHDWKLDVAVQADGTLTTVPGGRPTADKTFTVECVESGTERAAKLATEADIAVVVLGNHPMQVARECYDRVTLALPEHQQELISAVRRANPNTVLVIAASYPYSICEEQETVPAILYTSHAGAELGTAVAATLTGENNPAARCPITWYRSEAELPDIMEYDIISNDSTYLYYKGKPLYAFGHGLSYSAFEYSGFTAEQTEKGVTARVNVKNISNRDGDEVVQIYYRAENPSVKRPIKQLCGFKRVHIKAGESASVMIEVPGRALEFYDVSREKRCIETGEYTFMVGASSADIRESMTLHIEGETIPPRSLKTPILAKNYDSVRNASMDYAENMMDWYMLSGDWGGSVTFKNTDLTGVSEIQISACAPNSPGHVDIYADEECLGGCDIAPGDNKTDFTTYTIPVKAFNGTAGLRFELRGMVSVYCVGK